MKTTTKHTLKQVASGLVETVQTFGDGIATLFEWAESPHAFRRAHFTGSLSPSEWDEIWRERKRKVELSRLRKKKWIESRRVGEKMVVTLSIDGAVDILKRRMKQSTISLPDKKLCLVVFDFPEAAKSARETWRRLLKQAGFKQKQLSVWTTTKDVGQTVKALVRLSGIQKWVEVFECREV